MCGILGIVSSCGQRSCVERAQLVAMRDAMQARGPDAAGIFEKNHVSFAHRRLSIRDIEGGAQPWIIGDEEAVLVYNGELYNDRQLRQELADLGHSFRTRCDTEVVALAYRQWGAECVRRFRGMFALGIYDFRDESLFLARDRFGVKPLFLADVDGSLTFASSIPALLKHPRFVRAPNYRVLSHYLTTFRLTLGRETVFTGIWQLLPGETLRWKDGRAEIDRYWHYPSGEDTAMDYDTAANILDSHLRDAVVSRLASDVPVGMFLSGGVDSSTIASLVRESSASTMSGWCGGGQVDRTGRDDDRHDEEFVHAKKCASHVGFEFAEVRVGQDEYFDCWNWMLDEYATPLSTPTDVILYRLAAEMKSTMGVALGGEGADELLCGYSIPHWSGHDYDLSQLSAAGRWPHGPNEEREFHQSLMRQYGRTQFENRVDHYFALNSLIPTAVKQRLFQPWAWKQADADDAMLRHYSALFDEHDSDDSSSKLAGILHHVNLEGQLARLDSATMLAGLEARVPFTDHLLVEQMFGVPSSFKIDVAGDQRGRHLASAELEQQGRLHSKRILRTVAQARMPASLAARPKASFPTPVAGWMAEEWHDRVRTTLLDSPFGREVFQAEAIRELADNIPQAGMWLWPLVNVLEWGDRQFAAA